MTLDLTMKEVLGVVVAAAGAVLTALTTGGGTFGTVDTKHWLIAAGAVLGSGALTALVSNSAAAPTIKAIISFLTAGIGSLVIALNDSHITQPEYLTAFIAAVVATGLVYEATGKSTGV